jgi:hypothetical protein
MCERGLQPGSITADAAPPLNQSSCGSALGMLRKQLAPSFRNNSTSACRWCENHDPTGTAACALQEQSLVGLATFAKYTHSQHLQQTTFAQPAAPLQGLQHKNTSHPMQLWRPRTIAPAAYCLALSCVFCCCHQCSSVGIVLLQQQQHTAVNDNTSRRSVAQQRGRQRSSLHDACCCEA